MEPKQAQLMVTTQHVIGVLSIAMQELVRRLPEEQRDSFAAALRTRTAEYMEKMSAVMDPQADHMVTMHLQALLEPIGRAAPPSSASMR